MKKRWPKNMVLQNSDRDTMAFQVSRKHNKVSIDYYVNYEFVQTVETDIDNGAELYYNAIDNEGFHEAF